ncbi:CHC2 zinc finger domain-containing protein [Flavobacterium suzhouense]|uniref:CHC2 zinc finger domain-containing protein n=1 Tax=Flavobacterium suzhouense TaxID=1529638 RepID=A0ABW5NU49_9FLAO
MTRLKEKIKDISILDIAQRLGIEVKGKKALCFTGHDRNPSLSFNDKDGFFKCFGCEAKGDQIALVQLFYNIDFKNALKWFIQTYNLQYSTYLSEKSELRVVTSVIKQANNDFEPNSEIYEYLMNSLDLSKRGKEYLTIDRGFKPEVISRLEIKDINNPKTVFEDLSQKWGLAALEKCGLCKHENGKYKFIWWDYVIIFPFIDLNYRITYIQGRRLDLSKINIKYVNLKGVQPQLYNLPALIEAKPRGKIFLCEGVPDTISAIQLHKTAIGVLGATNFRKDYLDMLSDYQINIIPDGDQGGETFMKSVVSAFASIGKSVQKINLGPYKDLNEYLKQNNRP